MDVNEAGINFTFNGNYQCQTQHLLNNYEIAKASGYNHSLYKYVLDYSNSSGIDNPWNSNSNTNSSDTATGEEDAHHQIVQLIVKGYITTAVAIFGIVGNVLSGIILTRPKMKFTSLNRLLLGLTICDTLLLINTVTLFCLHSLCYYYGAHFCAHVFIPHILPYVLPIGHMSHTGSVYFTLLITVERWLAVSYPLEAKSICTLSRAKKASIVVTLWAVLYNLPKWFEFRTGQVGPESYEVLPTRFRCDPTYVKVYINWVNLFAMYLVPISCLIVLNVVIYLQIRHTNATRQILTKNQCNELSLAMMLIVIVLVYLVCNILPFVNNFMEAAMGDPNLELVDISNLLVTFNSSVNCIIYCMLGAKFRKHLLLLLHCYYDRKVSKHHGSIMNGSGCGGGGGRNGTGTGGGTTGTFRDKSCKRLSVVIYSRKEELSDSHAGEGENGVGGARTTRRKRKRKAKKDEAMVMNGNHVNKFQKPEAVMIMLEGDDDGDPCENGGKVFEQGQSPTTKLLINNSI